MLLESGALSKMPGAALSQWHSCHTVS